MGQEHPHLLSWSIEHPKATSIPLRPSTRWFNSPMLFILAIDTVNAMSTHVCNSHILWGIPLRLWAKMCYIQYIDDLIILTDRGIKDLFGLIINFNKKCFYSSKFGHLPRIGLVLALNYYRNILAFIYLEVLILGHHPYKQD